MAEFVKLQQASASSASAKSENSWTVKLADVKTDTYDLSVKNPNKKEEAALRQPQDILEEMKALDEETAAILSTLSESLI